MGASAGLAIPASILAGYGLKAAGGFMLDLVASFGDRFGRRLTILRRSWFDVETPVWSLLLLFSLALLTPIRGLYHDASIVQQVDEPSRSAMRWIRERTRPGASFVVVSEAQHWFLDRIAEWFPFLTERRSLTTAQGLEWGGSGVMVAKLGEITAFKTAHQSAPNLLPSLVRAEYCGADYVALFFPEGAPERQSFSGAGSYTSVFSNESAQIFSVTPDPQGCAKQASIM
jgi:hypothetical protein